MRQQWLDRNAYCRLNGEVEIPRLVLYRTWEDLLSSERRHSAIGLGEGPNVEAAIN